ncbi:MAG: hypothetical protein U0R44_01300 [Candidatus Micrarchaeia archaeon]
MSDNHRRQPDPKLFKRADPEATIGFRLPEPAAEGMAILPKSSDKVFHALKDAISRLEVTSPGSGILVTEPDGTGRRFYSNLADNLRSAAVLKVDFGAISQASGTGSEVVFTIGKTRSTYFAIYDVPTEHLYENPSMMSVNLYKKDFLKTEKGKVKYLSVLAREDLLHLIALAAKSAPTRSEAPAGRKDSLVPDPHSEMEISLFRKRLATVSVFTSSDPAFDMASFASSVKFKKVFEESSGALYYIVAGESETDFWLHVDCPSTAPSGCTAVVMFQYNGENCVLYRGV